MSMAHHTTAAGEPVEKHALFRITHADGFQHRVDMHFGDGTALYSNAVFTAAFENGAALRDSPVVEIKLTRIDSRLPGEGFTEHVEPEAGMPG